MPPFHAFTQRAGSTPSAAGRGTEGAAHDPLRRSGGASSHGSRGEVGAVPLV